MKNNYRLILAYDGSRYFGWEHQPDTELTIQGKLETVLSRMCGESISVIGAGRTDAGVHARAMCANALMDTALSETEIRKYLNRYLPEDISIHEVKIVSSRFHARYNARGKTYRYSCWFDEDKPVFERKYVYVLDREPDLEAMQKAASYIEGEHDFKCFCGNSHMKKSTVRKIDSISITHTGPYYRFYFHGTGFLQNQVRIMTGTLLEAGFHKRTPESVRDTIESQDRLKAGFTAPPQGLCLMKVDYD